MTPPTGPIIPGGSFTWQEYARLPRWGIVATPTHEQQARAIFLFTEIERLIRKPLGKPIVITSGARTAEYTKFLRSQGVKAALKSAHNDWQAVDLYCPALSIGGFWLYCDERWPGRMEKLEFTPGWVHLDTREFGKRIRFAP